MSDTPLRFRVYLSLVFGGIKQRLRQKFLGRPDGYHYIWMPVGRPKTVRRLVDGARVFSWLVHEWQAATLDAEDATEPNYKRIPDALQRVGRTKGSAVIAWVASVGGLTRAVAAVRVAPGAARCVAVGTVTDAQLRAARQLAGNITQVSSILLPDLAQLLELDVRTLAICHPDEYQIPEQE